MLLLPYDANNFSLVEQVDLIGGGKRKKWHCKAIKCMAIGAIDQVEAQEEDYE
jgi:hypothetical protein